MDVKTIIRSKVKENSVYICYVGIIVRTSRQMLVLILKTWGSSLLKVLYFTHSIIHFYKLNIKEKVINYILH